MHLMADGHCDDMLRRFDPPLSKQEYNDGLDARILAYLNLPPSCVTTVRQYLHTVAAHLPGLETICTHPGEDRQARLLGLQSGLTKLGIVAS